MIERETKQGLQERFKDEKRPLQANISEAGAFIRHGEFNYYVCYGGTNGDDIVEGYEKLLIYTEYLQLYQSGENNLEATADLISGPLNRMIDEYNIEKISKELKAKAEKTYINWCDNPERDDEGEWIKPSLSQSIAAVLDEYFENEDDEFYNKIEEILENSLDESSIHESMAELKENYRGLTDYERNSGRY